jgi:hypothetical protein
MWGGFIVICFVIIFSAIFICLGEGGRNEGGWLGWVFLMIVAL